MSRLLLRWEFLLQQQNPLGGGWGTQKDGISYDTSHFLSVNIKTSHSLRMLVLGEGVFLCKLAPETSLWEGGFFFFSPGENFLSAVKPYCYSKGAQPRYQIWNFKNAIKLEPAALGGEQLPGDRWWSGFLRRWADWFQLPSAGQGSGRGMRSQAEAGLQPLPSLGPGQRLTLFAVSA